MTENLIQKLEEKVMTLLTELETLRKEHLRVKQEHATMKADKQESVKKMQNLLSLLETVDSTVESHEEDYARA